MNMRQISKPKAPAILWQFRDIPVECALETFGS